jgi:hypothetical protein
MMLLTNWNDKNEATIYIEYDGNRCTLVPSQRLAFLSPGTCSHMVGTDGAGDVLL